MKYEALENFDSPDFGKVKKEDIISDLDPHKTKIAENLCKEKKLKKLKTKEVKDGEK
jgi:hypothetical protein